MMGSILDILAELRERGGIILGRPSMRTLYAFLTGYTFARRGCGVDDFEVLGGFGDYVTERFRMMGVHGWAKIIEFQSPNEEYEMKLFWELFDEYVAKRVAKSKTRNKKKTPRVESKKKDVA